MRRSAARVLCAEAPERFRDLESLGVRFDADGDGKLALGLEGGHSRRRVAHAGGSATGRRILRELSAVVAEHPRIEVLEGRRAAALRLDMNGRCAGLDTDDGAELDGARGRARHRRRRRAVVAHDQPARARSAPGCCWRARPARRSPTSSSSSSTPPRSTGIPGREGFLVSEAVRGEGATLHDADGERFVDELAPRDHVARAIRTVMDRRGDACVYLDMRTSTPAASPTSSRRCARRGSTRPRALVPVAPAAHYVMGGIATDLRGPHRGRRPLRGRRVRLHRTARSEPARLQLAL